MAVEFINTIIIFIFGSTASKPVMGGAHMGKNTKQDKHFFGFQYFILHAYRREAVTMSVHTRLFFYIEAYGIVMTS